MEDNKPNPIVDLLIGLGVSDANDLLAKPENFKVEEVLNKISIHQRALISTDQDYINPYIEQGRQEVAGNFYKALAQRFDVKESELINKPVEDVATILQDKAKSGMTQTAKDYEDKLTELKKERDALKAQINQTEQTYLKKLSEQDVTYAIKAVVSRLQLTCGINAAENHVITELINKGNFQLTKDGDKIIVTNNKGQGFRPTKSTNPNALSFSETIEWLLSEEKMLQTQPKQPTVPTTGFGFNNTTTTETKKQVSQSVIENAQRLKQYAKR